VQLPDHIETEHQLTGELTLILNPIKPYSYIKAELTAVEEPAAEEPVAEEPAAEVSETVEPEAEPVPGEEPVA